MEDYDAEYALSKCCKELGLKLVHVSSSGDMSDFEPDDMRWWGEWIMYRFAPNIYEMLDTLSLEMKEELLEYLFKNCDDPEKLRELFINLSPYYRGHNS